MGGEIRWRYRILHEDGSLEYEGYTIPSLVGAVIVVFTMAEKGENGWRYQVVDGFTNEIWVSFKRGSLGISLERVIPMLDFPKMFPQLPIIRRL